ncbi:MAG: PHP domain-containing protein [Spirochaetota bacterium]
MAENNYSAVIPVGTEAASLPFLRTAADPAANSWDRIAALRWMLMDVPAERVGGARVPRPTGEINNHVHTIYSFSPYTPAMAAWRARAAGLSVAGSVDHDSVAAAAEMLEACAVLGIGSTVGFELRVSCAGSPFGDRKINNPDSIGIAYMTIQGIPRSKLPLAAEFLRPLNAARSERNQKTTAAVSAILTAAGYEALDYRADVLPLSKAAEGGSVTERHILAAATELILRRHGPGPQLVAGLASSLGIQVPDKLAGFLADPANPHLRYDLLGLLKSGFLDRVFVQPGPEECLPVATVTSFARSLGAIPAYAYLGDVADSLTGDKKAERFEDDFLDELLPWLVDAGFQAVTYMPPRNTAAQLVRLRGLCEAHGLMEISGVDINSSRQSFSCPEVLQPSMSRLIDTTWALVAHEKLAGLDPALGLFAPGNPLAAVPLAQRIDRYAEVGRGLDPEQPEDPDSLARLARGWR